LSTTANPRHGNGADMVRRRTRQLLFFGGRSSAALFTATPGLDRDHVGAALAGSRPPGPPLLLLDDHDAASARWSCQRQQGLADTWCRGSDRDRRSARLGPAGGGTNVTHRYPASPGPPRWTSYQRGSSAVTSSPRSARQRHRARWAPSTSRVTTPDGRRARPRVLDQFSYEPARAITAGQPHRRPCRAPRPPSRGPTDGSTGRPVWHTAGRRTTSWSRRPNLTGSPGGAPATVQPSTATTGSGTSATSRPTSSPPKAPRRHGRQPADGEPQRRHFGHHPGTGLIAASQSSLAPVRRRSYTVTSATQVTAVSPAETAGTVDVVVTTRRASAPPARPTGSSSRSPPPSRASAPAGGRPAPPPRHHHRHRV